MRYTEIATATPFEGAPRINLADRVGASPGKPILIKIPTTGARPIIHRATSLPKGLRLENDILTGCVREEGTYEIGLIAENALGSCEKQLRLEIKRDTVLLTPLLGFTSWNAFGFRVTQEQIEETAAKMCELGLNEYGYNYVNIDSGWQGEYGGKFDAIMPNEKFPDMKGMCDRLHALGFKCGIYSTPMLHAFGTSMNRRPLPLGCTQGEPDDRFADTRGGIGVIRKERNNALQWADWGFDYLKYDWRPSDPINAELMRQELVKTDRDFGFCVTVKARAEYHNYWKKYCNSYRCNPDSKGSWKNLLKIYRSYFEFIDYINPGHFFDLDMLDVGKSDLFEYLEYVKKPDFGFCEDEMTVAYTMRAFLNSPIQISCRLSEITDFEYSLFCNEEIIAINQDVTRTAVPCLQIENGDTCIHAFRKPLSDGSVAYAIFNLGETCENVTIYLDGTSNVRDAWAKEELPSSSTLSLPQMPPHTVKVFKTNVL